MISAEVLAHEKELEENLQALSNRNRKSSNMYDWEFFPLIPVYDRGS